MSAKVLHGFMRMGGCLLPSLFLCLPTLADTVTLKNGKDLKGLVVEEHADRVILSTENGEIPIFLKGVKNIKYDVPEQNFLKVGKSYEVEGRLGEALAFYEKALEVNPSYEDARKAAAGVRSRFWAMTTEGPRDEIEKKQILYDSWERGQSAEGLIKKKEIEQAKALQEGLGVALEKKGDWVFLLSVESKREAASAGLKKNDRLVAMDGRSLRYLTVEVVAKTMVLPHYSNFVLEFERDCFLHKGIKKADLKDLGFKLKLSYEGLLIQSVKKDSAADRTGLKDGDLLVSVNGASTRYMPLKKVTTLIQNVEEDSIVLTIRRSALLTRK